MSRPAHRWHSACNLLLCLVQIAAHSALAAPQFSSHITVNTPARSFSHGVGHPTPAGQPRRPQRTYSSGSNWRRPTIRSSSHHGYAKVRPSIPFTNEDIRHQNALSVSPWHYDGFMEELIPVLPPSPYRVDSPDPESLWPEGLFLPPRFLQASQLHQRREGTSDEALADSSDAMDPYLLEGSEAIAAVVKARQHGLLYFHDIPHIESLLANQEVRILNNLKPHRLGSIRHTWPYNRP